MGPTFGPKSQMNRQLTTGRRYPYTRRRYMKRASSSWRRPSMKRMKMTRSPYTSNSITSIKRHCTRQIFGIPPGGTFASGVLTFQLSDLPGYTTLNSTFDCYRIRCVVVRASPVLTTVLNGVNIGTQVIPIVVWAVDYDDNTVPGSTDSLRRHQTCRAAPATVPMKFVIRPRASTQLFLTGATTGYGQTPRSMWLDCAQPGIPHYGLKFGVDNVQTTYFYGYNFELIYYLQFKQPI